MAASSPIQKLRPHTKKRLAISLPSLCQPYKREKGGLSIAAL
jgi:hypothetical protein